MSQEDLPDDTEGPQQPHRRRRPPVLDLEAKDVGAQEEATQARSEQASAGSFWDGWRARAATFEWRAPLLPVATAAAGVIGGALIVYLLLAREAAPDPRVGELSNQVAALATQIESLAKRPPPAPPDNSAVLTRIDALMQAVQATEKRLAAVEERPVPPANERSAAIESTLQELRSGLSELRRAAAEAPAAATPEAIGQIAARIGALEQRIAALAARPELQALPAAEPLAERLIALNQLRDAALGGKPYAAELGAAQARLGDKAAALSPLEATAKSGLPTLTALRDNFQRLVPEFFRRPEATGGFLDRLVANAARLVEVRPVGEPEGASVGAIIARAETGLERGDLSSAIKEVEALPESMRAKASAWLARARQRLAANELLHQLTRETLMSHAESGKP
jgi:hypothetical protein